MKNVQERYAAAATTLPPEADDGAPPSLGLGDVVTAAAIQPGETVLDLGSGPGRDLFAAARATGESGRAIGVDFTPEMIERSRAAAAEQGLDNVAIVSGELESLPVPCGAVDVIISNCVINLTGDKRKVLAEAFRVLRPGGRFVVLDTAFESEPGETVRQDADAWSCCVAGSLVAGDYESLLNDIGFTDVSLQWEDASCTAGDVTANAVLVRATKPADAHPGTDLRPAVPADRDAITSFLEAENLPTALAIEDAMVAVHDGQVVGLVAVERNGAAAHLRSLVVHPDHRKEGIGFRLVAGALEVARWSSAVDVYLFTKDAAGYFDRYGFSPVDGQAARDALEPITVDAGCCEATAMHLDFEQADLPMLGKPSKKALPTFDCSCC